MGAVTVRRPLLYVTAALVAALTLALAQASAPPASAGVDPADFTVDTLLDLTDPAPGDGTCGTVVPATCSVRAAVQETNALAGAQVVDTSVDGQFLLTIGGPGEDAAATGDVDVTDDLTLRFSGSGTDTVNATTLGDRAFDVRSGTVTIQDATITGGTASSDTQKGGAVQVVTGSTTLSGLLLGDNSAGVAGGAVEVTAPGTATISATDFDANSAGVNGGGLHLTGAADAEIIGGEVIGNVAAEEGGGFWNGSGTMTVDGTSFSDNEAQGGDAAQGGGGLFNAGGRLVVTGSTIDGTNAATGASPGGNGGGLMTDGGSLVVSDSTVAGNQAARAGGGIENSEGALTLTDVDLDGNTAMVNGGGLHVSGAGTSVLTGGNVVGNTATQEGGGLWNGSATMTVEDVTIEANVALGDEADPTTPSNTQGGGGIFNNGGALEVDATTFAANLADPATPLGNNGGNGGGILTQGGSLVVDGSTFVDNEARRAGGAVESNGSDVTITDSTANANLADVNGGVVHVTAGDTTVDGLTATRNQAGQEGGGLWNNAGTMAVSGSLFIGNDAAAGSGDPDQGGGALFQNPGGTLTVDLSRFVANTATDDAGSGGAILNDEGTVGVTGSSFTGNVAVRAGGAIEVDGGTATSTAADADGTNAPGDTTVTRSRLRANRTGDSPGNGGALHVTGPGDVDITDSEVSGNRAANEGGGLWVSGSGALDVTRSLLRGNTTPGTGGGIHADGSGDLTVVNSTLVGNASDADGGGIRAEDDLGLTHVTLRGNSSGSDGSNVAVDGTLDATGSVLAAPGGSADENCVVTGSSTGSGNHVTDDSCDLGAGQDDQGDPRLGPVRDNGGATESAYPLDASPLVDAIPSGSCAVTDDQRAVARPFGAGCDIGAVEQVFPAHSFTDSTAFFEAAIRWVTSTANDPQILLGFDDGTYRPTANINRGNAARLLYNEAGAPDVSGEAPNPFPDVSPFFDDAVTWAFNRGIFLGFPDDTFRPNADITRGQLVRAKYQFAGAPDVSDLAPNDFGDVGSFFDDAVTWGEANGFVLGYPDDTFRPDEPINRGNAARFDHGLALRPEAWADPGTAPANMLFRPSDD